MRRRGLTLLELLVAGMCLASLAAATFAALSFTNQRSSLSIGRALVLQVAANEIEAKKAAGFSGTLAAGTVTKTVAVSGISGGVTLTTITSGVPGHADLFEVRTTATWSGGSSNTLTVGTMVRNDDIS